MTTTTDPVQIRRDDHQERLNGLTDPLILGAYLQAHAESVHREYPQYGGYFDGWEPVRLARDVRYKGGNLYAGDIVLRGPSVSALPATIRNRPEEVRVYSVRKCSVSVVYRHETLAIA